MIEPASNTFISEIKRFVLNRKMASETGYGFSQPNARVRCIIDTAYLDALVVVCGNAP